MEPGSIAERPPLPALPLVFASVGFAGLGLFAWLLVAFATTAESGLQGRGAGLWLLLFGALAGTATGSAVACSTRRWWPFFVGVAITLVPIALAVMLVLTAPTGVGGAD
jgi:uncharacterized membrane protein YdfJ with MMPL/SSD domain